MEDYSNMEVTENNQRKLTNPYAKALEGFGLFFGIAGSIGSLILASSAAEMVTIILFSVGGILSSIMFCVLFLGASEVIVLLAKNEEHLSKSEEYLKDIRDAFAAYDNQNEYSEQYESYPGEVIDELPEL